MSTPSHDAVIPDRRSIIVRLSLIAASAVFLSVQLHEYAHGIATWILGGAAAVRAIDSSSPVTLTERKDLITTAAGPLFSLVFGLVLWTLRAALRQGFWRTFLTWTALASIMNFCGYLMISFVPDGDTGVIYRLLDLPDWIHIVSSALGTAGMFMLAWLFAHEIAAHWDGIREWRTSAPWPALWGTLIVLVVYLVAALLVGYEAALLPVVVLGPGTALVAAPMAMMFVGKLPSGDEPARTPTGASTLVVFGLTLALVLVHALVTVKLGSA